MLIFVSGGPAFKNVFTKLMENSTGEVLSRKSCRFVSNDCVFFLFWSQMLKADVGNTK